MSPKMQRRAFISLLGGAAVMPVAARAQPPAIPVIGFLSTRSPEDIPHLLAAFLRGLAENGYVEGQNVTIEYRWALGQYDRLQAMAAELAGRPVVVIVAAGGEPAAMAAKAATSTIPIAFVIGGDPVTVGLAASYNRPGGNATGISIMTSTLDPKRLGLLHEVVPRAATVGALLNPNFPGFEGQLKDMQEAARTIGVQIFVLRASDDREVEAVFETVAQQRIPALAVGADPFFDTRRDKLVALAARHAVPAMYHFREFATAGGLMSYGIDISEVWRQVGVYAGRMLKGAKPADLPVLQPTKFELVINLKTAKELGLAVPPTLLARADEVIE
jgi:putative tryptophan/tyrosine transport system substrate-binding protein